MVWSVSIGILMPFGICSELIDAEIVLQIYFLSVRTSKGENIHDPRRLQTNPMFVGVNSRVAVMGNKMCTEALNIAQIMC